MTTNCSAQKNHNVYLFSMMKFILFFIGLTAIQAAAQEIKISKNIRAAMDRIDTNAIRSHIAYLADDRLKGRLPGTEGYQVAVDYVIDQYKKIGVKPSGDDGGFTQKLVIRKSVLNNASAFMVLKDKSGNKDSLVLFRDFWPLPHPMKSMASAEGQLVFMGYGVDVPEVYSDFKGMDVKGKIAIIIAGAPDGFQSTITAHLSSLGSKVNNLLIREAAGVIVVNPAAAPPLYNPDTVMQINVALKPDKSVAYSTRFTGNLPVALTGSQKLLRRLFMNSGKNLDSILADIKNRKPSSFILPFTISATYNTAHTDFESFNVVGVIPGSDKHLKNEYVVHSAHLDHVGIGKPVDGDSIYNGAHDNASGVASLLEIAKVYQTSGAKPKRSVLIVMVTGEEMGLIGSSYFANNPTVPLSSIVANVNTDMPTVIAPLLSVVPLGAAHSSLTKNVEFATRYLGLDIEEDPEPKEVHFVRSDQYSFVKKGIPSLNIKYGNKSNIPGFDMMAFVKQWRAKYYHKPADDINGLFNFTAAKTFIQLNFLLSYSIAQTIARPVWNKGDLFGVSGK